VGRADARSGLRRFWTMLATTMVRLGMPRTGASAGVNESTTRRYLDVLTDALMIRQLQPWHANIGKRQIRSPRSISEIPACCISCWASDPKGLLEHPKVGASWEGFVIEQVLLTEEYDEASSGRPTRGGDRPDSAPGDRLYGVECKRADAPRKTPSIRHASNDLGLETGGRHLPRQQALPLAERWKRSARGPGGYRPLFPRGAVSEYFHVEKPFLDQLAALGWKVTDQGRASSRPIEGESAHELPRMVSPEVFREAFASSTSRRTASLAQDRQLDDLRDQILRQPNRTLLEANERYRACSSRRRSTATS